jgi:hypothetical protein
MNPQKMFLDVEYVKILFNAEIENVLNEIYDFSIKKRLANCQNF